MQPIYSIVVATEWVLVNDPTALFAATDAAGIPRKEVESGMAQWDDGVWYVRAEVTKRIPKARREAVKGIPLDTPEAREGRIHALANAYAAIPAAFDDSIECDYSPLDD